MTAIPPSAWELREKPADPGLCLECVNFPWSLRKKRLRMLTKEHHQVPDEVVLMGSEEVVRAEILAELKGVREDIARIETRMEKDEDLKRQASEKVYERLRKLEIKIAITDQRAAQLKRDLGILAAALGAGGGAIGTAITQFFGG